MVPPERHQTTDWRSIPSSHQWSRREDGAVFKQSLKKSKLPPRPALQEFLMQYRRTPLNTGFSHSQLLNGRQLRIKIDALLPSPANIAQEHQAREATKSQQKEQTAVQHVRTAYDVGTPCTLCTVVPVKPVHQDGFQLQSPESMALEHSPSRCIPEEHYGNDIWSKFNLATELPRIPTPVSSPVNNPHQLTVFQKNQRLRPCHHLQK